MKKLLLSSIILASTGCQAIFDKHCDSFFNGQGNGHVWATQYELGFEGDAAWSHIGPHWPNRLHWIDRFIVSERTVLIPSDGSTPILINGGPRHPHGHSIPD